MDDMLPICSFFFLAIDDSCVTLLASVSRLHLPRLFFLTLVSSLYISFLFNILVPYLGML